MLLNDNADVLLTLTPGHHGYRSRQMQGEMLMLMLMNADVDVTLTRRHHGCRSRQMQGESYEEWVQEMVGMRTMLAKWANVSDFDIFGMRAPRLKPGDNRQFDVSHRGSIVLVSGRTV